MADDALTMGTQARAHRAVPQPTLRELDDLLANVACGVQALRILSGSADFRHGESAAADQLQSAVQWIADRLADQVNTASDITERLGRAAGLRTPSMKQRAKA